MKQKIPPLYAVVTKDEQVQFGRVVYMGTPVSPCFNSKIQALEWQLQSGRRAELEVVEI